MVKAIDIEYCGSWGYGGAADRLKKELHKVFPDVEIICHAFHGKSQKIEVSWIEEGHKHVVWSKSKD